MVGLSIYERMFLDISKSLGLHKYNKLREKQE